MEDTPLTYNILGICGSPRRANTDRLIGKQHVLQIIICRGVHGHGLNAHFATGALNTQGNLAAIGYYDFVEHAIAAGLVGVPLIDDDQGLTIFDRLAVLHANGFHDAGHLRFDLVHHLHRFDDAERVAFVDAITHLNIGCGARR